MIDMIPASTIDGGRAFVPHAGGDRLQHCNCFGTTGHTNRHVDRNDLFGEQLISALRESQVDTSHVIVSGRPTTLAFVKLEEPEALR